MFFCFYVVFIAGGFDQHNSLRSILDPMFAEIDLALGSFRYAAKELDLWDKVTLVISSEFGRTTTPNASGGKIIFIPVVVGLKYFLL